MLSLFVTAVVFHCVDTLFSLLMYLARSFFQRAAANILQTPIYNWISFLNKRDGLLSPVHIKNIYFLV